MADAAFKPVVVGVSTLSGYSGRMRRLLSHKLLHETRLAIELRLDIGGDWQRVLAEPALLEDAIAEVGKLGYYPDITPPFPPRVIAACRRKQDGGEFDGNEAERLRVLALAAPLVNYVDLEDRVDADVEPVKIIRSFHDLSGVPDFEAVWARLVQQAHGVIKIVGTAHSLSDNLRVRDFLRGARGHVAAFLMGAYGVPSRILTHAWGGKLSYNAWDERRHAPGMLTLREFLTLYRGQKLAPDVAVVGVTGTEVEHSHSPRLHNTWLLSKGLGTVYVPLKARDFADFEAFARALPLRGASVTVPFKEPAAKACSEVDAVTGTANACNTLMLHDGTFSGSNTDADAFLKDVRARLGRDLRGCHALILGAGGAARAAAFALKQSGATVESWARRTEQAHALAVATGTSMVEKVADAARLTDLLVNATPCGMAGANAGVLPLPWTELEPLLAASALVYDMIYNPVRTPLLSAARRAGFRVSNGWGMLVHQAAAQAKLFGYSAVRSEVLAEAQLAAHVWLIGFRTSGKSTLAPLIAEELGAQAIDTDQQIERRLGKTIAEILGPVDATRWDREFQFRSNETSVINEVATLTASRIVATGGGAIEEVDSVRVMRETGQVVYLDTDEETLIERLERSDSGRPTLTGLPVAEEARDLLKHRRPLYEAAAHITIKADRPPHVLAGEIVDRLAQFEP